MASLFLFISYSFVEVFIALECLGLCSYILISIERTKKLSAINLEWLIDAYKKTPKTESFFGNTFTIHAGTKRLQQQLEQGLYAKKIRESWKKGLAKFKKVRKRYLIYD